LSSGNATPATVKAPVEQVQTGGFGDPTGLKGKGDPNKGNIVVRQGLPTLPGGPGLWKRNRRRQSIRGTVASSGAFSPKPWIECCPSCRLAGARQSISKTLLRDRFRECLCSPPVPFP